MQTTASVEIDLSDLITVHVHPKTLELTLRHILERLHHLERQNAERDHADGRDTKDTAAGASRRPTDAAAPTATPTEKGTPPTAAPTEKGTPPTAPLPTAAPTAPLRAAPVATAEVGVAPRSGRPSRVEREGAFAAAEDLGAVHAQLDALASHVNALDAEVKALRAAPTTTTTPTPTVAVRRDNAVVEELAQGLRGVQGAVKELDRAVQTIAKDNADQALQIKDIATRVAQTPKVPVAPSVASPPNLTPPTTAPTSARLAEGAGLTQGQMLPPQLTSEEVAFVRAIPTLKRDVDELKRRGVSFNEQSATPVVTSEADRSMHEIPELRASLINISARFDSVTEELNGLRAALSTTSHPHERPSAPEPTSPDSSNFEEWKPIVSELQRRVADVDNNARCALMNAEQLKKAVQLQGEEVRSLGVECSNLGGWCQRLEQTKADKDEPKKGVVSPRMDDKVAARVDEIVRALAQHEQKIAQLHQNKASNDDLLQLQRDLVARYSKRVSRVPTTEGTAEVEEPNSKPDLTSFMDAVQVLESDTMLVKGQLRDVMQRLDQLHHGKADAAQVANKAERDYVENAMDKLMREVEQVLNATNAGIIDTLDKSLGILRDLIDGKATKQDITKLQQLIGEERANVPEGLTGYRGYRCLGCNRTMENMRPRPMGAALNSFLARLPSGGNVTRGISRGPATQQASSAGVLTAPH